MWCRVSVCALQDKLVNQATLEWLLGVYRQYEFALCGRKGFKVPQLLLHYLDAGLRGIAPVFDALANPLRHDICRRDAFQNG
jgi:hypothetical protein